VAESEPVQRKHNLLLLFHPDLLMRLYLTPFMAADGGTGAYKTWLLPSGSFSTANLINHPDVQPVQEFREATRRHLRSAKTIYSRQELTGLHWLSKPDPTYCFL
jgi:hypothetical protein